MTFYRSEKNHQNFRRRIGEKLRNKKFALEVINKLKEYTDWFNEFTINHNSIKKFLQKKEEFVNNYRIFFAYHQAVYWGGDYLIEKHPQLKKTISDLQKIYAYNENVVPDVEKYLHNLKIDHLTHNQTKGEFKETGILFLKNQNKIIFHGKLLDDVENYINCLNKYSVKSTELKGICASKGKIIGRAQIIKNPNKLFEAKKDRIIITGMTRPQFNHILSKCKGIVTDEGNILSHASILAREFKIPCLVGVKNSTETFKNGDLIELDATNGIVRLIKRNN